MSFGHALFAIVGLLCAPFLLLSVGCFLFRKALPPEEERWAGPKDAY